jgi:hypothetical protein
MISRSTSRPEFDDPGLLAQQVLAIRLSSDDLA